MKKFSFVLSVLVLASFILAGCGPKPTTPLATAVPATAVPVTEVPCPVVPTAEPTRVFTDLGGRTITVAVENIYPPFNSIDQTTNKGVGYDYDVFAEICLRLNCVADMRQAAWEGIFPAMAAGEYDVLADGVTTYPYRYWAVDFSIPYTLVSQQLMVRADDTHTLDDFVADANLKVGSQIATTNYIAAGEFFPDTKIQAYSEFGAATLALLAGDIDGVVLDDAAAYGFMQANPGLLKTIGAVKTGDALAFVFPPYSDLVNPVNAALRAMHDDGTLLELNRRYGLADPAEAPPE